MIIETENLRKLYRTDVVETNAVDSVNLAVKEGQFVSIISATRARRVGGTGLTSGVLVPFALPGRASD